MAPLSPFVAGVVGRNCLLARSLGELTPSVASGSLQQAEQEELGGTGYRYG